jgi:hypothetical protein
MKHLLQIDLKMLGLLVLVAALQGCGGGGGSSSHSSSGGAGGDSAAVQGVATPSSVSVVTAQNAGS